MRSVFCKFRLNKVKRSVQSGRIQTFSAHFESAPYDRCENLWFTFSEKKQNVQNFVRWKRPLLGRLKGNKNIAGSTSLRKYGFLVKHRFHEKCNLIMNCTANVDYGLGRCSERLILHSARWKIAAEISARFGLFYVIFIQKRLEQKLSG